MSTFNYFLDFQVIVRFWINQEWWHRCIKEKTIYQYIPIYSIIWGWRRLSQCPAGRSGQTFGSQLTVSLHQLLGGCELLAVGVHSWSSSWFSEGQLGSEWAFPAGGSERRFSVYSSFQAYPQKPWSPERDRGGGRKPEASASGCLDSYPKSTSSWLGHVGMLLETWDQLKLCPAYWQHLTELWWLRVISIKYFWSEPLEKRPGFRATHQAPKCRSDHATSQVLALSFCSGFSQSTMRTLCPVAGLSSRSFVVNPHPREAGNERGDSQTVESYKWSCH